jgi:hypothetical protein
MASNVNPLKAGMVTDDPRFNARYLGVQGAGSPALVVGPEFTNGGIQGGSRIYSGIGVPQALGFPDPNCKTGDVYLRQDPGGAGARIYVFINPNWVATAA